MISLIMYQEIPLIWRGSCNVFRLVVVHKQKIWWCWVDSNHRLPRYERDTLAAELQHHYQYLQG